MRGLSRLLFGIACLLSLSVDACLWDKDTLLVEQSQFPSALELITGYIPVHSTAYYQWVVEDRLEKLEGESIEPEWMDDLGVAYEKLGETQKAIDLMLAKEKLFPGLYTTAANLGTFYIHHGEYDKGLVEIKRAITINPDAHFGREIIQQRLVEYVLLVRASREDLPLEPVELSASGENDHFFWNPHGFGTYLLTGSLDSFQGRLVQSDYVKLKAGLVGVEGMLRFGNNDSPILLEALGDVLTSLGVDEGRNGNQLAALAYLRASTLVGDKESREGYRQKAFSALQQQHNRNTKVKGKSYDSLAELEVELDAYLQEADDFRARFHAQEKKWIESGEEPDALFQLELQMLTDRLDQIGN